MSDRAPLGFLTPLLESLASAQDTRAPEVDAELVRSLVQAGTARCLAGGGAAPASSPPPEDLFPGLHGLPEVSRDDLDARVLGSGILHHGALLVRGLYGSAELERLDRAAAAEERAQFQKLRTLRCSDRTLLELLAVYESSGLLRVARDYLGDGPVMMRERTELRKAYACEGAPGGLPWHQDVSFFGRPAGALNCWATVTGCGQSSPGLVVVPRRLAGPVFWDLADGPAPLRYGAGMPASILEEVSRDHPAVEPVMQPGDAILFDEMTLHRSGRTRWSAEHGIVSISWFFHPSRFLEGRTPVAI